MKLIFDTHGNEKQKECCRAWVDPNISEIVYGGAKGGAKSYTGCSLSFGDAFLYPETHYFIARKHLNDLRKYTIPSIHEVFNHWKVPQSNFKYNGQDSVFELYNKSKIYLLDAKYLPSDPTYMRFGSMQMTRGWIEEAGEFEEEAKINLQASIGRWKNDVYNLSPKLLMTCNPSKNFLYKIYKENKQGILDPKVKFIQALPQDNKMLSKEYIENLHRILKGAQKQRLLLGNWEYDDSPDVLIEYEKILDLFTNSQVRNESAQRYITADIARMGSDKAIILVWRGWEVIEMIEYATSLTTEIQNAISSLKVKYSVPNSNIIADEDGVGGGVVDNLYIKGFVNNSKALKSENYQNLKTQCYYKYAERVGHGGIYLSLELSTKQRETIIEEHEQIKSYLSDSDGKLRILPKEQVKQNIGHSPDYSDAIIMREWFELKTQGQAIIWTN